MMKVFYIILGVFITFMVIMFLRVGDKTDLTEVVEHTEKIQLIFYQSDGPEKFVDITDRSEIKQFDAFISNEDTPVYTCGYTGRMVFFLYPDMAPPGKNTIVVEFNVDESCRHAAYYFDDALQTKTLTKKGVDYLNSIKP